MPTDESTSAMTARMTKIDPKTLYGQRDLGDRLVEGPDVEERLILIERLRGFADGGDHRRGIGRGAHQHGRAQRRAHARGAIEDGRRLERLHFSLPDRRAHADDRQPRPGLIFLRTLHEADAPAQRVLVRQELGREPLVDDDDLRPGRAVRLAERASALERHAERFEVAGAGVDDRHPRTVGRRRATGRPSISNLNSPAPPSGSVDAMRRAA